MIFQGWPKGDAGGVPYVLGDTKLSPSQEGSLGLRPRSHCIPCISYTLTFPPQSPHPSRPHPERTLILHQGSNEPQENAGGGDSFEHRGGLFCRLHTPSILTKQLVEPRPPESQVTLRDTESRDMVGSQGGGLADPPQAEVDAAWSQAKSRPMS